MKTTILFLCLFWAQLAKADILFLDLNFATSEHPAAEAAAKARGEKLWLFPERTAQQQASMDAQWRLTQELQSKLSNCLQASGNCTKLDEQYHKEKKKMDAMASGIQPLKAESLKVILAQLKEKGVKLSSIIFSGHSSGTSFGGLFGNLSEEDIKSAFASETEMAFDIQSVLLWGCYTGTLNSLNNVWKKIFPSVKIFVGYEQRSPLGIRESSGRFLKSTLLTEKSLVTAPNIKEAHKIFKTLDLVADLDGTAEMGGYFMSYEAAEDISQLLARCGNLSEELLNKYRCYNEGKAGCENPPPNHLGPLREFYNYLQANRHCSELLKEKYPDLPTPDRLIRFIYLDNIKRNFESHHKEHMQKFSNLLDKTGMPQELGMDKYIYSTRAQDVPRFRKTWGEFIHKGLMDGSIGFGPFPRDTFRVVLSQISFRQAVLSPGEGVWMNFQTGEECIPLTWVDLGASEKDKCGVGMALEDQMTSMVEALFNSMMYNSRLHHYSFEVDPVLYNFIHGNLDGDLHKQRELYVEAQQKLSERISWKGYLSPNYEKIMASNEARTLEIKDWTDRELAQNLISKFPKIVEIADRIASEVNELPNNQMVLSSMRDCKERVAAKKAHLEKLLQQ